MCLNLASGTNESDENMTSNGKNNLYGLWLLSGLQANICSFLFWGSLFREKNEKKNRVLF